MSFARKFLRARLISPASRTFFRPRTLFSLNFRKKHKGEQGKLFVRKKSKFSEGCLYVAKVPMPNYMSLQIAENRLERKRLRLDENQFVQISKCSRLSMMTFKKVNHTWAVA
jgi:hypothetical protein